MPIKGIHTSWDVDKISTTNTSFTLWSMLGVISCCEDASLQPVLDFNAMISDAPYAFHSTLQWRPK